MEVKGDGDPAKASDFAIINDNVISLNSAQTEEKRIFGCASIPLTIPNLV